MKSDISRSNAREFIIANTKLAAPYLCPEIKLRLITEECTLWKSDLAMLQGMMLPEPYWGFCWAGGQALARHILDNPGVVRGKRVFDFGAGGGVEAIAAGMSSASSVLASDIDEISVEALKLNAELNGVIIDASSGDYLGSTLDGFDLLLAGDMFYEPVFARKVTGWFDKLATGGMEILIGDPGRGNLPQDRLERLASYNAPSDVDTTGRYLREASVWRLKP